MRQDHSPDELERDLIDATNRNTALASAMTAELHRCGVEHAVIAPGSRSTPLALALHRQAGIDASVVVDERSAGFLALGAAAASRRPVVVLCTSGTAAANLHPAVCEADLSALPLILLTADRPSELRGIGAGQTIDQLNLYGAAVRWFCEAGTHEADDAGLLHFRSIADRAFALAAGDPRPGPVHLNVPLRDPLDPTPEPESVTATSDRALRGRHPEPLTRVARPAATAPETLVAELAREIVASRRGLILAGRQTDPRLREPLAALAKRSGYPILAEPTSQMRLGPHDHSMVSWQYDAIARDGNSRSALEPELVLRFGELPTSKALRKWLSGLDEIRQVVIDAEHGWSEPTRLAERIVRADPTALASALVSAVDAVLETSFAQSWLGEDAARAEAQRSRLIAAGQLTAPSLHDALASCYEDGDLVYTASSLPIREQEWYLPPGPADATFLANRGANGIDGLISSGIGACIASGRPTVVITGDVGLLHDLGGLASWRLARAPLRILVVNNWGGGIFELLPQRQTLAPGEFEELMATPPGIEVERAAALFDLPYRRVERLADLAPALSAGTGLIEVPVPPPSRQPT